MDKVRLMYQKFNAKSNDRECIEESAKVNIALNEMIAEENKNGYSLKSTQVMNNVLYLFFVKNLSIHDFIDLSENMK